MRVCVEMCTVCACTYFRLHKRVSLARLLFLAQQLQLENIFDVSSRRNNIYIYFFFAPLPPWHSMRAYLGRKAIQKWDTKSIKYLDIDTNQYRFDHVSDFSHFFPLLVGCCCCCFFLLLFCARARQSSNIIGKSVFGLISLELIVFFYYCVQALAGK